MVSPINLRKYVQKYEYNKKERNSFDMCVVSLSDVPEFPLLMIHFLNDYPRVTITTGDKAPAIPRQFYIQYRKMSGNWLEIWKPFSDTLPGQGETNYQYDFSSFEVQPDTKYEIRVKSVDQFGLAAYSSVQSFTTKGERLTDAITSSVPLKGLSHRFAFFFFKNLKPVFIQIAVTISAK